MPRRWTSLRTLHAAFLILFAACGTRQHPEHVRAASDATLDSRTPKIHGLFSLPPWGDGAPASANWSVLDPLFNSKSIVLLGESLHVTSEFPIVRLPILQHLHERLHFDVIAVEGSMVDAWLAQDDLLRAQPSDEDAIRNASQTGWLTIWNTPAMRSILDHVSRTGAGDRLYFASMDIQPGMDGTAVKKAVMRRFIERIFDYAGEMSPTVSADQLAASLDPLRTCSG